MAEKRVAKGKKRTKASSRKSAASKRTKKNEPLKRTFSTIAMIARIIAWPFKMLGRAIKRIHRASESNAKRVVQERQRPRTTPKPNLLEVIELEKGSISAFDRTIAKSSIGIILGARGSGKTALGLRLLENVALERPCAAIGFKTESLPRWIKPVGSVDDVPNGSCVLIDEGGILFSSRSSMSEANKVLSELMLISRHRDLSIIFISQNSSNLEVNVLRQADYLVLKPASLLQLDFERKVIEGIYRKSQKGFERHRHVEGLVYVYSDAFTGFASNALPSFWEDALSTQFSAKHS